jgi:hypothetical protein
LQQLYHFNFTDARGANECKFICKPAPQLERTTTTSTKPFYKNNNKVSAPRVQPNGLALSCGADKFQHAPKEVSSC